MEVPDTFRVELPHLLAAYILVYERDLVAHEAVTDLRHDDLGISTFEKAHIRINESKPEFYIVICDPVKATLAFFGIVLGHRNLAFENVEVYESLQILREICCLGFKNGRYCLQLTVACRDCFYRREVASDLGYLLLKQEVRLIIQIA